MDLIVSNSAAGPVMDWGAGPRRCAIGPNGMGQKKEVFVTRFVAKVGTRRG